MTPTTDSDDDLGFPDRLVDWLADVDHQLVLEALANLRYKVVPLDEVVDLLLRTRPVKTLKFSWELWEALVRDGGAGGEQLLLQRVPSFLLETARLALWGEETRTSPHMRLRLLQLEPEVTEGGFETE
jgi:hypothetical protein